MAKRDEQRRINIRPEGTAQAASTLITATQVIGGTPNTLGGWVFGPASLSNSGVVLHSGGWIQVGVDDYTVRLDAIDTAYRMWAGAPLGGDAPFSITVDGSLHAENAYIEGEIVAAEGAIGGFEIGADYIRDAANSMGLASTVAGGDDVRFWAGDTFANRATAPFRVTEAGLLTATGATIEGAITATTGELVDLDVSGTLTLVSAGIIQSDNYSGGLSGWKIDYNGDAEFANIHARGRIDTAVFQYDQISAVAGSILVTPEAGVLAAAYTTAGTLTIEGAGFAFATGDVVRIRAKDTAGAVKGAWLTVTRTGTDNVYTTAKESGDDATWPIGTAVLGYGTGGGSLLMTAASALDGPRYSILTHSTSPWTDETEVGRLGFLDDWQTYAGVDYGIAIGDYGTDGTDGNYLLYGTTTGFVLKGGAGDLAIDADGLAFRVTTSIANTAEIKWGTAGTSNGYIGIDGGPTGGESQMVLCAENGVNYNTISLNATGGVVVSADIRVTTDVWVIGDYKNYRNATTYTGYIFVPLATPATSTAFDGDLYDVDNDGAVIDLSASFGIPAGVKAVSISVAGYCATVGKRFRIGPSSTYGDALEIHCQAANVWSDNSGVVPCDANGDVYFTTDAVHGAEFAVYMRIWGYWI